MQIPKRKLCRPVGVALFVLAFCMFVWPQQQAPGSSEHASQDSSPKSDNESSASGSDDQLSVTEPEEAQFHFLRGGDLIGVRPGFIHVGPLYISSLEALWTYGTFPNDNGTDIQRVGDFRASLFLDKKLPYSRITFQYTPQVAVINGSTEPDFVSQNAGLNSYFKLTPHTDLEVSDHVNLMGKLQNLLPDSSLSFNTQTGYVAQNDFLLRQGQYFVNNFDVSLNHDLGTRTRITLSPILNYVYDTVPNSNDGFNYGGQFNISRRLTAHRTVGAYYRAEKNQFSSMYSSGWYHTVGVSYGEQLGRQTFLRASIGATSFSGASQHWTGEGNVSLTKGFGRRSALTAAYSRGNAFAYSLSNGFADQVDVGYTRDWTDRFETSVWGGYYGEIWTPRNASSRYGRFSISYRLFASLRWYAGYVYRRQAGSNAELLLGTQQQGVTGLQWAPSALHY